MIPWNSGSLRVIVLLLFIGILLILPVTAQAGSFAISTVPSRAAIYIDNAFQGEAPLTVNGLTPGSHVLRVELAGYDTIQTTINIVAEQTAGIDGLVLNPISSTGSFAISTVPSRAAIYIDNAFQGETPLTVNGLTPGSHVLRVELAGYDTIQTTINIVAEQTAGIDGLVLTPSTSGAQTGSFFLSTSPSGGAFYIDGTFQGYAPQTVHGLTPGTHALRVDLTGYDTIQTTINIVAEQTAGIDGLVLTPWASGTLSGSLAVTSTPSGASVYVDGVSMGETPLTITGIAVGSRIVKIGMNGYETSVQTITVSADQTVQVNANLVSQATPAPTTTTVNAVQTTPVAQPTTYTSTVQPTSTYVSTAPTATPRITSTPSATTARSGSSSATASVTQPSAPGTGSLSVTTIPAGAQVYLDGILIGNSPTATSGLAPGSHTLQMKMTRYQDLSVPVSITAGQTTQYSSSLVAGTVTPTNKTPGFAAALGVLAVTGLLGARRIIRP